MSDLKSSNPSLDTESQVTLGLLNAVHENSSVTQRTMAGNLGIALGLANAYLKRCVKKGLIKVRQAPANRYAYYLTPQGFTEKSRLTAEFLSQSFNLFRLARKEGTEILGQCQTRGWNRVALYGLGDLAEIFTLSARDFSLELVAVVNGKTPATAFAGLPVVADFPSLDEVDVIIICDIVDSQGAYDAARGHFPDERILVPAFLAVTRDSGTKAGTKAKTKEGDGS